MAAIVAGLGSVATPVEIETVPVGNPGNPGEWSGESYGGYGPDGICGAVDYGYRIGKFEVTAGQYTEFLNAVAETDTYGLYDDRMGDVAVWRGCNIQRSGSPNDYSYSVAPEWADRPVNFVSWGDAARFANWMTNGQPDGGQDATTTEEGSYTLNGATRDRELIAVERNILGHRQHVIPTEDEWYKAAYHKNERGAGNFWDYPTDTDTAPSNDLLPADPGNNANFYDDGYTIGGAYWRTEVGEFENSGGPYGTFDQGGNVWEWNETAVDSSSRGFRGGSYFHYDIADHYGVANLHAATRLYGPPTVIENSWVGFRLAEIPEPGSMAIFALGGLVLLRRRSCQAKTRPWRKRREAPRVNACPP